MTFVRTQEDQFKNFFLLSLALHLLIVLLYALKIVIFPSQIITIPDAIRVDIVGLPDKIQAPPQAQPKAQATPVTIPDKKKESTNLSKPKDLKVAQQKAMAALKQKEALESLKNFDTKPQETPTNLKPNQPQYKGNAIATGNSFTGISSLVAQEYWSQIKRHAQNFWSLPEWLAKQPLKASILVRLDSSGRVTQTEIYKSSGNQAFDMAALSSIEAASPFPVPPDKIRDTIAQSWIILNLPD
jgi:colicin import membrane protein